MLPEGYQIRPLSADDASALAAAYRRNRDHLDRWDPDRPDHFFTDEGQVADVARQLAANEAGRMYAFVLWYDGAAVGRVMLANLVRGHMQSATVGYWVDHEHLGRGLAVAMLEQAGQEAVALGLHRLEAGTMPDNLPSQAVLKRAGFTEYGVAERLLYVGGEWRDHVLFQRILHDEPLGVS